ncbi:hypothetical protein [Nocardia sp. IFM 10818]
MKVVSSLMVVRSAFEAISADPVGLPPECVIALGGPVASWGRLREALCEPGLSLKSVDTVWVWLVRRARQDSGGQAALVCAGLAVPMLTRMARRVSGPRPSHDADAQVLVAFLAALGRVDLDRRGVWPRLRWAAWVGARAWVTREAKAAAPTMGVAADEGPLRRRAELVGSAQRGHPELLLAQAVAEGVLTEDAAGLIAATRLGARSLTAVAAEYDIPYKRLEKRRSRAEAHLATWLRQRLADQHDDSLSVVERHVVDTMSRARTGGGAQTDLGSVSQTGVVDATTRNARTTRLPARPAPVEVNRRCA